MMYIMKVNNGDGILTYMYQDETRSKYDIHGIKPFIDAFKKYYSSNILSCSIIVMNDRGEYLNPNNNKYEMFSKEVFIPLNKESEKELEKWKKV